jgi:hypothetical protein
VPYHIQSPYLRDSDLHVLEALIGGARTPRDLLVNVALSYSTNAVQVSARRLIHFGLALRGS